MYDQLAKLIEKVESTDASGDIIATTRFKEVYVGVKSVGMKEKYQALSVGLQPELVLILADYFDYNNESLVEFEGMMYNVLRTYRKGMEVEVVIARVDS